MKTRFSSSSFDVLRKTGTTALLFATLLYIPLTAQAWTVKVENPLKKIDSTGANAATVTLYYGLSEKQTEDIGPETSYTFETGWGCPYGLSGNMKLQTPDKVAVYSAFMQGTDMYGTWYTNPASGGAACWNHTMVICAMPEGRSSPYSFCKK